MKTILVTGGAGFIGANFVLMMSSSSDATIVNLDKLTYAGNLANLDSIKSNAKHLFVNGDICDRELVRTLLSKYTPDGIFHFAAESHVDRSIHGAEEFVQTNVLGTFHLIDEVLNYWQSLPNERKERFRLLHVSTDEVYGSLQPDDSPFTETTRYSPNSPYSATKAASDHLVRAYHETYGLPIMVSNCSNNYGPYQFPEKLIPLIILNAFSGKSLPIYGDGLNVRDWLYVEDHCQALKLIMEHGKIGETYNIGGNCEKTNIDVVNSICNHLDSINSDSKFTPHNALITYVKDRLGHDRRYAIDGTKIKNEIGWKPKHSFDSALEKTIRWYLNNEEWVKNVQNGSYRDWLSRHYDSNV